MFLLLIFAFLAGLATILAPCIWPVLPIVLSSSIAGKGHKRPLGITIGLMLSFTIFTLFISFFIKFLHLDPNILRVVAVIVIIFFGLTMIIPKLALMFELLVSKLSNLFGGSTRQGDDFISGFITGIALGIVWSPCAGPILATIAALAATGKVSTDVILITLFYVLGLGIPLFLLAYGGQKFVAKTRGISKYLGKIQKIFGVITILAAIAIFTNYAQTLQLQLIDKFPVLGTVLNGFENSSVVTKQLNTIKGSNKSAINIEKEMSGLFNDNSGAPDFIGINKWLNTDKPLSIKDLKGKVVLVDFWTYTCINCIRTLPHVTSWYNKYKDQGFVVVGVHTPEFAFEHETNNVLNAIAMYKIHYPVAQDNDYATWNNYNNQYWPAEYLIDASGKVRRTHFGEGEYDQMEQAIQLLLKDAGQKVTATLDTMPDQTPTGALSPETYIGAKRMQYYYPSGSLSQGQESFTISNNLGVNSFSLGGEWNILDEYSQTVNNSVLNYNFYANKVFLVLKPSVAKKATVKVFLDGKPVDSLSAGSDVVNGVVKIDTDRLYNLIDLKGVASQHLLRLEFQDSGIQVFAFTFG